MWALQPNPKTPSGGVTRGSRTPARRAPQHRPYWNATLQADYCEKCGEDWPCLPYRESRPPKCRCSHIKHAAQCWHRSCGCTTYRPQETEQ